MIGEEAFDLGDGVFSEVKNAGGEDGVGASRGEDGVEMFEFAGAATSDDGDADGFADSAGDDEVVACFGAIGVDGIEDDFAGTEGDGFGGPIDGIEACRFATALDKNFPAIWGSFFGIDTDDDALAAEAGGARGDEVWGGEGAGVDADLIGAAFEHEAHVVDCADASADGERHKAMGGSAFDDIDHRVAALGTGGDIEEDHFIGALFVVADGEFDRVADDAEATVFGAAELDTASDFTVVDIEAGNDAFREHRKRGWSKSGWKRTREKRAREIWVAEWLEGRWRMGKTFGGEGLGDEGEEENYL